MKTCSKCGITKPPSEFPTRSDTGKLRSDCRACRSSANLKRYHTKASTKEAHSRASLKHYLRERYDLTVSEYEDMLSKQSGRCAICENIGCATGYRLSVDHCHETGRVRSLLCQACNTAIGKLNDNPALLRRAANYIESHAER